MDDTAVAVMPAFAAPLAIVMIDTETANRRIAPLNAWITSSSCEGAASETELRLIWEFPRYRAFDPKLALSGHGRIVQKDGASVLPAESQQPDRATFVWMDERLNRSRFD